VESRVLGQHTQFLVEHFEALLGNVVGHDVVDGDLQVIEPRAVEALDALGGEQVAVGDHAGDHAVAANARDDQIQSGCSSGSPPLMVTMVVPSSARRRSRCHITSSGTGLE